MATMGLSKGFILDKYFSELQKFWDTERKLQDTSSSNEAASLHQRLRSLSSELVTLRSRLHVSPPPLPPAAAQPPPAAAQPPPAAPPAAADAAAPQPTSAAGRLAPPPACSNVEDLSHLEGPLTEHAVMRCLYARFQQHQLYTNVGSILVSLNSYKERGNSLTLNSTRSKELSEQLQKVVRETVRQQTETGYPQGIILSGASGSGKTYTSMLLLRQLFLVAGGGTETDAFKHLAAAFTVLRSLGTARTASNSESSRIGHFIEVQVTDGALYRTKIHCYFLDQTRVVQPLPGEKNYHVFYQMLAGLSTEERARLHLEGQSLSSLRYLRQGERRQDLKEDARRFQAWKSCLGVLGIPFLDVVRVLAAVLLLGNITFVDGAGMEVEVQGLEQLQAVASLLGFSAAALRAGLTTRTHNVRGQLVRSLGDANVSSMTRDSLAKALYCRTVATIVRRANSLKRLGSTSGTLCSSDDSHVHLDAQSAHASTVGTAGSRASKSMSVLNSAVRHATDGFIGILDMFGFEEPKPSRLEHLCINLCSETMQHFYNTHIFKSSLESCREEGITCEVEVEYVDNVPCIDLISSLRTGLLSMMDVECGVRGSADTYLQKVRLAHRSNARLCEPPAGQALSFAVQHYAGKVAYSAADFLDTNRDCMPDDLVSVFHKQHCSFGFASHLFGTELKVLYSQEAVPRGVSFRISPTSNADLQNGDEPVSTLTQDFHTRLDNLLRTLVHAKPHFVRCVKANDAEEPMTFQRPTVMRQIRALQLLETVNLMATGYPHRMRFRAFNTRYRLLSRPSLLHRTEEKAVEDCRAILAKFQAMLAADAVGVESAGDGWALGKRHIFLTEGTRQRLEQLREQIRLCAAVLVQSVWRGWRVRRRWPQMRRNMEHRQRNKSGPTRPRPQPITGTPPPDVPERCEPLAVQQTCSLFGLDLERPPPLPPARAYTVNGNRKLGYPQERLMLLNFPDDDGGEVTLLKGDTVLVVGASSRRGHLLVECAGQTVHVPHQYMELKSPTRPTGKL
ncbi:myosin-I heavy chain-like [Pollicipes pollicipes]|uniref:myosin-I heavy chain-like n=1 Tax=Pollicipes pollicipes TaxID=41117 RepID=UPI001884DC91|nr:myosin-I heavy chain-like [Pollicipes pollicipes]